VNEDIAVMLSDHVTCHYCVAAHDSKVEERIEDYRKIISGLDLPRVVVGKQYKSDGKQCSFVLICWKFY